MLQQGNITTVLLVIHLQIENKVRLLDLILLVNARQDTYNLIKEFAMKFVVIELLEMMHVMMEIVFPVMAAQVNARYNSILLVLWILLIILPAILLGISH